MAVAPPLFARMAYDHQTIVGYFQLTPLALTTAHYVLSWVLRPSKSTRFTSDLHGFVVLMHLLVSHHKYHTLLWLTRAIQT